jgi:putative transcriptional regulator
MNNVQFEELLASVKDMGKHMCGQKVSGDLIREFEEPDVKAIRERTGMTQTRFAFLIGVRPKTLQNWEQKRVRPAGPARALLKIVEANPQALTALHS